MSATSTHTKPAGRVRIMIVDPELQLGLRLADCLATSGYQAVLVRDLESTLGQLGEIKPEIILLSQDSSDGDPQGACIDTLRAVNALCPLAPVLTLNRPMSEHAAGLPYPSDIFTSPPPPTLQEHQVEDVLCTHLGIPCMRVQ